MYWVNTELNRTNTKSQGLVPAYFVLCAYLYCVYALAGEAISIRDRISVPFHESVPKNRTLSSTGPLSVQ